MVLVSSSVWNGAQNATGLVFLDLCWDPLIRPVTFSFMLSAKSEFVQPHYLVPSLCWSTAFWSHFPYKSRHQEQSCEFPVQPPAFQILTGDTPWGPIQMSFQLSPSVAHSLWGLQPGREVSSPSTSIILPSALWGSME